MEPVSVYRVCAGGADGPSYSFGGELPDADFPRAVWLGWLPLVFLDLETPSVALPGDVWLTASQTASDGGARVPVAAGVTAEDAAGELAARGQCDLNAFTSSPEGLPSHGVSLASSLALLVADDLEALVAGLRDSHAAVLAAGDDVDEEVAALDACQAGAGGDSPVRRRYGLALRDLREDRLRLHRLLEAVVRIGIFDPAASPPGGSPPRPAPPGRPTEWDSGS